MSKMLEFELLCSESNAVVARHPDRSYPGLLIQGDTLRTILDDIEELSEGAEAEDLETVKEISEVLKERFIDLLTHYEKVLKQHGQELPYTNSVSEKNT
jgi:hypothetical protein